MISNHTDTLFFQTSFCLPACKWEKNGAGKWFFPCTSCIVLRRMCIHMHYKEKQNICHRINILIIEHTKYVSRPFAFVIRFLSFVSNDNFSDPSLILNQVSSYWMRIIFKKLKKKVIKTKSMLDVPSEFSMKNWLEIATSWD